MAKKKKKGSSRRQSIKRFQAQLQEAEQLYHRERWSEAYKLLEELDRRYPNRTEVLSLLMDVSYELRDMKGYEIVCARLLKLVPHDADLALMLAGGHMANLRPVMALSAFQRFLQRWPDHERAQDACETVADLKERLPSILTEMGLTDSDGFDVAVLHEEAQFCLDQGNWDGARQLEEQILERHPDFIPALNNLSQIHWVEGRLDQAVASAEQVIGLEQDNLHALSNLTRYYCLVGRVQDAQELVEELKSVQSDRVDSWVKKAEAMSYLGDDQGVLDVLTSAKQAGHLDSPLADPQLYHFAAVAALRFGQEKEARRYWRQAKKLAPNLRVVQENLEDLVNPIGERHAPWPFAFVNWVGRQALVVMVKQIDRSLGRSEKAVNLAFQRYLRRYPQVSHMVPFLLDRGDPQGREFALRIAVAAQAPEMLVALRDFALGQWGPDAMRHEAARVVSQEGLLPDGPVRMWMQGDWREVLLLGFEIHGEALRQHSSRVERWMNEAIMALNRGDGNRAESLLLKALEVEPGMPDILNNLATTYGLQGREREGEAILRQLLEEHPDYLFARTMLARLSIEQGEIEEAESLLDPLMSRRRFHFAEFSTYSATMIQLYLAKGQPERARSWLEMWASVAPDDPALAYWQEELDQGSLP